MQTISLVPTWSGSGYIPKVKVWNPMNTIRTIPIYQLVIMTQPNPKITINCDVTNLLKI